MEGQRAAPLAVNGKQDFSTSASSHSPDRQKQEMVRTRSKREGIDVVGLVFFVLLIGWLLAVIWKLREKNTNLWPIVGSCFFFEIVNRILSYIIAKPTVLPALQSKNVDNFINTAVSLVHSTLASSAVISLVLREIYYTGVGKVWTHEVLTASSWTGASAIAGASCGYFAYDQWDMLRRHLYNPRSPSLLVHHAVLLACFTNALFQRRCINYLMFTLVCEAHSIFLHLRKVSLLAGVSRKWSFVIGLEWTLNWLTFVTTRSIVHVLITLRLIQDFHKFGKGTELPFALTGMAGLNVLNVMLGKDIYKAYLGDRFGRPGRKQAD